ncbi:hypothetical protein GCM10011581_34230 [Saccharopolyspora subtropica]|uniref:HTH cro/C1-type domain-containing protein n=1 Tax=Saccharopolyspora thermophila TaxID=89367 RepID=A0A917NEX1_9PSEU|nr:helix-turn-helix domain-containing protein [Saccharopolyspora subtropica]GGI94263.1 hypothetical protein GCM10011581_34230 [Saccharopolyspora subtropica]
MDGRDSRTFAERLRHLIKTVHPADRGPYSYREVEAGIRDHPGAVTAAYVQQLASGKQPNPRKHTIEALAAFFGVPVAYFFDDAVAQRVDAQLSELVDWRNTEAGELMQRLTRLSPGHREAVAAMIDHLAACERRAGRRCG